MTFGGDVRRLSFKIKDYVKYRNKGVIAHWKDIDSILAHYNTGRDRVAETLENFLNAVTSECPHYFQFSGKKLSEFPVMTKVDLIANRPSILNPIFAGKKLHSMSTSGSTGMPFTVVQNLNKRNRVIAELKYFGEKAGYRSHEKMIFFRVLPKTSAWKMLCENVWVEDIAYLNDENAKILYQKQNSRALIAVKGYASTFDILTRKWLKQEWAGNPLVRTVLCGAEIFSDDVRERCRLFWPNATVYSRYSNQENGVIAQEAGQANEYEINWASYFVEILQLNSNQPAVDGEVGQIVLTDMFNRAFPMIRYDTGDLGVMRRREGNWPVLSSVEGRRVDLIFNTAGLNVSPHIVTKIFWGLKGVQQWQFIQEESAYYRIKFIPSVDDVEVEQSFNKLLKPLRSVLGETAEFALEKVDEIPRTASGKFKPILQAMKNVEYKTDI